MKHCNRCDFAGDPTDLEQHADDAAHPLCLLCPRSLTSHEPRICENCLTKAQEALSGVVTLFAVLPSHLGHLKGSGPNTGSRSSDGRPLPGGDVLALLSEGSEGLSEDGTTTKDNDPPSIAYDLGWWAMAVMDERRENVELGHTSDRIVLRAGGYLETRLRWCSVSFDGFTELARDLDRLHTVLQRHTSTDLPIEVAHVGCFDCHGRLERRYEPSTGLAQDWWTCGQCKRRYTDPEYRMALAAAYQAEIEWIPLTEAARRAGVNVETVERWGQRGQITVSCRIPDGRRMVRWSEIEGKAS